MIASFSKTHKFFKIEKTPKRTIWGSEEANMCRQYLGENNPNELLKTRKWFTSWDGIYIRNDCLNNELVTWFTLKAKAVS